LSEEKDNKYERIHIWTDESRNPTAKYRFTRYVWSEMAGIRGRSGPTRQPERFQTRLSWHRPALGPHPKSSQSKNSELKGSFYGKSWKKSGSGIRQFNWLRGCRWCQERLLPRGKNPERRVLVTVQSGGGSGTV